MFIVSQQKFTYCIKTLYSLFCSQNGTIAEREENPRPRDLIRRNTHTHTGGGKNLPRLNKFVATPIARAYMLTMTVCRKSKDEFCNGEGRGESWLAEWMRMGTRVVCSEDP